MVGMGIEGVHDVCYSIPGGWHYEFLLLFGWLEEYQPVGAVFLY